MHAQLENKSRKLLCMQTAGGFQKEIITGLSVEFLIIHSLYRRLKFS